MVTTVEGIEDSAIDLGQLAKILKGACASGGTVKGRNRASGRSQEEGRKGSGTEWIQGGGKMMSNMINLPWISHNLTVLDSNDPTLVGLSGTVVNETKKTIIVRTQSREISLAKDVITFAIDSGDPIIGSRVTQRAEERISRRY